MSVPGRPVSAPTIDLAVEGIGSWSSLWPDWAGACAVLRGDARPAHPALTRPGAALLAGNERRRAPLAVALALEAGAAAVAMSGRSAANLPSVFTSAHGDLATTDALCSTLAQDPRLLSPTRFHHSVHNAASGYWAVATGSGAASTALAAYEASFATGLLEAALLVQEHGGPVLLVGHDTEAVGALTSTTTSRGLLALALVLAPWPGGAGPAPRARMRLTVADGEALDRLAPLTPSPIPSTAGDLRHNALADALPLAHALALAMASHRVLALAGGGRLHLALTPGDPTEPASPLSPTHA